MMISGELKGDGITAHIGYVQSFVDDYLNTLHFLLKQAKEHNNDVTVFTYTLPIIITAICFLESNINFLIGLFNSSNDIVDYHSQNIKLTKEICNDFIQLDKTPVLEKYYIILKYYKNIDIKRDKNRFYSKVTTIVELRNLLVHDKSYSVTPTLGEKDKIVKLLENQKWLKPNNLPEFVQPWLPYLEYENTCRILRAIFEFYIDYSKLLIPEQEPFYQNKIQRIISWHPLMKNLEGIENAK
ncbi:MAG: hypothetical protein IJE43_26375 [Alphaproteobacteria bacterium]|nr:hypothetical protein [Alphaproteobacteria bacterium]